MKKVELVTIRIYIKGICKAPNSFGGWSFIIVMPNNSIIRKSDQVNNASSSNRMELIAMLNALQEVGFNKRIVIYSDNQYAVNVVSKWMSSWRNKGWINTYDEPIKNKDIIESISIACDFNSVYTKWLGNNDRNVFYTMALELATKEMNEAMDKHFNVNL